MNQRTYSPLWHLVMARIREFYREPDAVFWVYCFPILIAVALGIAFRNRPVEQIHVDLQVDGPAEALMEKLKSDPRIQATTQTAEVARKRLRTAKTDLVLVPFTENCTTRYEYWLDPNRPECALARSAVDSALLRADSHPGTPIVSDRTIEEPGGRYIDFLIPGLIGMNLMGGGLWGVGYVIVDLRIRKLLKRYLATPMRKGEFLLSIALSRMAFTVTEVLILQVFAWLFFSVGVQGRVVDLIFVMAVGAASFMGVGLLVACRTKTAEGVNGLMNLVMLPMYVLSGIFFSSDRFPDAAQPFIRALPLTALNDALRAVMLDGTSVFALWPQLAILTAWGVVTFVLALRWFRWN